MVPRLSVIVNTRYINSANFNSRCFELFSLFGWHTDPDTIILLPLKSATLSRFNFQRTDKGVIGNFFVSHLIKITWKLLLNRFSVMRSSID